MTRVFEAPIPGQSLTMEPKSAPWENPPEINTVEEVAKYYIEKLADQDIIDDLAVMCEMGVPLKPVAESIYMMGVMRGVHTIDVGMLVAPVITSFLKQAIESYGITVKEEPGDPAKKAKDAEINRFKLLAMKYLKEEGTDMQDPGKSLLSELVGEDAEEVGPEEEMETPEFEEAETPEYEAKEEAAPKGLMARG